MKEINDFLKECGTYYLATIENDQPRVRPFGTINFFENRLYIFTGRNKEVSKQMNENPKIEICGSTKEGWIRIQAIAIDDDRFEAKKSMLEAYPFLTSTYSAEDDNAQVLYLKDVVATIYSFDKEPKVIKL